MKTTTDLTEREEEVMLLMATGKSIKQIAAQLGITPKTAAKHKEALYFKLKVDCPLALARLCIRRGYITVEEFLAGTEGENRNHEQPVQCMRTAA